MIGDFMKKIVFKWISIFVLLLALALNLVLIYKFDTNIGKLLFSAHKLTDEDREYLKAHGPIYYGSDNNSPPLRFYDLNTDEYKGIVIDYLRALSIELETEIVMTPMVWEEALLALKRGKTDICDMYPSRERAEIYLFSDPIYYQRGVILIPKSEKSISSYKDLSGKKVAIQSGDYAFEFLNERVKGVRYDFGADYEVNLKKLISGEVSAIVGDEPVISYFLDLYEMNDDFHIVDEPLYELPSVLSLHITDKKLMNIINKGIYALNEKEIIDKIQQKWFGISTPIGSTTDAKEFTTTLLLAIAISSIFAIGSMVWNFGLKKAVLEQTNALNMSKNNLQKLLDGLNQLIAVISSDSKVHSGNALFYDFFNRTLNSEFYLDAIIPNFSKEWARQLIDHNETCEMILKGRTYQVVSYPVQYENKPNVTTMLLFEDITDKKLNEKRLLRENKMAAVGQLATGVAHEIRNPLGLIRNYLYLLKKNPNDLALEQKAFEVIEDSVDKASTIIDNLLNFSRLSNDEVKSVALKALIEKLVQLNEKALYKKNVNLNLILEDVKIDTHEESLKHIFINIINNGLDAILDKGQLTISLKATDRGAVVHFIDNGIGMTESTISKLFDPFFTTKNLGEGTGLGLYIVYNELSKMGGKVDVLSKLGKGSIFKITLIDESEGKRAE